MYELLILLIIFIIPIPVMMRHMLAGRSAYRGIVEGSLTAVTGVTVVFLVFWAVVVVVVQLFDYFVPIWGTKKFGGSKRGVWGSSLGLIAGLFAGPWGIILGPFVGALLGELSANKSNKEALRAAFGAFVGFLLGTISKLIVAGFLIYYYFEALI